MTGCVPPPYRFSYSVAPLIDTSAPHATMMPSADSASMLERAAITITAPDRPSARPTQRDDVTSSPVSIGANSATRIGCIEVISATAPADRPRSKAMYEQPK